MANARVTVTWPESVKLGDSEVQLSVEADDLQEALGKLEHALGRAGITADFGSGGGPRAPDKGGTPKPGFGSGGGPR